MIETIVNEEVVETVEAVNIEPKTVIDIKQETNEIEIMHNLIIEDTTDIRANIVKLQALDITPENKAEFKGDRASVNKAIAEKEKGLKLIKATILDKVLGGITTSLTENKNAQSDLKKIVDDKIIIIEDIERAEIKVNLEQHIKSLMLQAEISNNHFDVILEKFVDEGFYKISTYNGAVLKKITTNFMLMINNIPEDVTMEELATYDFDTNSLLTGRLIAAEEERVRVQAEVDAKHQAELDALKEAQAIKDAEAKAIQDEINANALKELNELKEVQAEKDRVAQEELDALKAAQEEKDRLIKEAADALALEQAKKDAEAQVKLDALKNAPQANTTMGVITVSPRGDVESLKVIEFLNKEGIEYEKQGE